MAWIETIDYEDAEGKLKILYDRIKGPENYIDNVLKIHSLRPHSLEGHMALYKNVLHHSKNELPKWLLEALGVYVSILNACSYCVEHHYQGMKKLLNDSARAGRIRNAFENYEPNLVFEGKELTLMHYAEVLVKEPYDVNEGMINDMRENGLGDGEILEANQVISYFCYVNRTVLGLGVTTEGDILGLSPGDSDNPENWQHK